MPFEFKNQRAVLYCYLFCSTVVDIVVIVVAGYLKSIAASIIFS